MNGLCDLGCGPDLVRNEYTATRARGKIVHAAEQDKQEKALVLPESGRALERPAINGDGGQVGKLIQDTFGHPHGGPGPGLRLQEAVGHDEMTCPVTTVPI